jgi:tetratricopeptide (TPR) repeat protein
MFVIFAPNHMRGFFGFILVCFSLLVWSQSTDEKLAAQFYENEEYEKAEGLYKKLNRQQPNSVYIYESYLSTLLALKEKKSAENLVEKQIRKNTGLLNYEVDLGYVYLQFDEKEKATKYFEKLIKENANNRNGIISLAQSFSRRQLNKEALNAYEVGTKKQGVLAFYPQLISEYKRQGNTKDLTDFSLEVLANDREAYEYVTNNLDRVYEDEAAAEYLQGRALSYAQKNPSNQIYDELLLEVFLQQKKYSSALRQVTSLDKRNNNKGSRVLQLASVCIQNSEYNTAIKAYQYVVDLGKNEPNFATGKGGLINALYLKTTSSLTPDMVDVDNLMALTEEFISSQNVVYATASSSLRLAELQLFYKHNLGAGVAILEELVSTSGLRANFIAECKLLLGDAYLMQNNIWDAKLMYGQVDKQFKEDALGQEAKFKNAKLSYYTADFEWAKGQLDILKTATSQLISNNAIELALRIQDNTGLDTTEDAMKEYAAAEFCLFKNEVDKCTEILNLLPFKYPDHSLQDEIYYLKAQVQEKLGNYEEANKLYTSLYTKYADDILADNALFKSANITLQILDQPKVAQDLFEKLILEYNSSLYAVDARAMYYGLKEGKTKEELFFE